MTRTVSDPQRANLSMIDSQLLTGEVVDPRILSAFASVPRDRFVPEKFRHSAYVDEDIQVSFGRYLVDPLTLGKMLVQAAITESDTVLDIAPATGYSSAVMSYLAQKVVAVEEVRDLADKARANMASLSRSNVEIVCAVLTEGCHIKGPYSVILIQGAVRVIPPAITDQLAEGGRLVCVENVMLRGDAASGLGKLVVYTKVDNALFKTTVSDASVPILPAFQAPTGFQF